MERSDMITLTTFWLDWVLLPILFFLAWQDPSLGDKEFQDGLKIKGENPGTSGCFAGMANLHIPFVGYPERWFDRAL